MDNRLQGHGGTPYIGTDRREVRRYPTDHLGESVYNLAKLDASEVYPNETEHFTVQSPLDGGEVPELVCILCESGYHDHAWDVTHVMRCGCPCHHRATDIACVGK